MPEKPFLVSDESKNSYGFRLISAGGDFTQFHKNPVMLYDHDSNKLPIGTWEDLTVHPDGRITAVPVFDEEDEFALSIKKKVDKGIIKMCSISAYPREVEGDDVTKWEAREISITPFGSNKNAFRLLDNAGNTINLSDKDGILKLKEQLNSKIDTMAETKDTLRITLAAGLNLSENVTDGELIRTVLQLSSENTQLKLKVQDAEKREADAKEAIALSEKKNLLDAAEKQKKITVKQRVAYEKMELSDLKVALEGVEIPANLSEFTENKNTGPSPWEKRMAEINGQ